MKEYHPVDDDLFIGKLINKDGIAKEWNVEIIIKNKLIVCQIDTGAQANILSVDAAKDLKLLDNLKEPRVRICTFNGEELYLQCKNILGIDTAVNMNLIKQVNCISINNLVEKYSEVFKGLGCLQNECNLLLRDDVVPVVEPPRRIPFKLHESLKKELDRMMNMKFKAVFGSEELKQGNNEVSLPISYN
ncbi:uncharacterized protein LOC142228299 [Haematobia irritans]|uniref:uncharacterized protein LOC142228299 n=1 Tax=Haematobia irritans TaxID=7368 RepID=UPI003F4FDC18